MTEQIDASDPIGMFGLGIMGGAMAANLAAAGFRIIGFDPVAGPGLAGIEGLTLADDPDRIASETRVMISSLPGGAPLAATVEAIVRAAAAPCILIETSTLTVDQKTAAADSLRAHGHTLLDCPLSGTGAQAVTRDLTVYASGDSAAIARVAPVFRAISAAHFDLGEVGNGSRMKYVANLLVSIHNAAAAEAIALGIRAGLDPARVIDVVRLGAGGSRMLEVRGPLMAAGKYQPVTAGFPTFEKDMRIIADFAAGLGARTPMLDAAAPLYAQGAAMNPDADVAAIAEVLKTGSDVSDG